MIVVNLHNGDSKVFNLQDPTDYQALQTQLPYTTALAILHKQQQHVLPYPSGFKGGVVFGAELVHDATGVVVAERIFAQVDAYRARVTLYLKNALVRYDLIRTGKLVHNPSQR